MVVPKIFKLADYRLNDVESVARSVFHDLSFRVGEDDHYPHKTFKTLDGDRLLSP